MRMAGRFEQTDQDACYPRPACLRGGTADLELGVAVDDLPALDERGQVRLVGDVEEHRRDPDEKADAVELPDRQRVEEVGDRDRCEQPGTRKIAGDQDRSPWQAVDPDARGQAHEQEREELDRCQRSDLERACVEHVDRGERQRQLADLRPELTDGLRRPELQKIGLPPETPFWPEPHGCSVSSAAARARSIRTSPLTVFTNSSTSGASAAGAAAGASESSNSELVEPLTVFAST